MAARGTVTPFIPPRECAEWSVTDQLLKLKNGSVITFRSADSGREKFQGLTRDWVHVDEEPPKPIFERSWPGSAPAGACASSSVRPAPARGHGRGNFLAL